MATARPDLIALARDARGLTQAKLATLAGMSQARISKVESGAVPLDLEPLSRIAKALELPMEFFFRQDSAHVGGACFKYRKRAATGARNLRQIEACASMQAMRVDSLLKGIELEPPYQFPRLDVGVEGDFETPTEAAIRVRALWGLPRGPIHDLTAVVEAAGALVIRTEFDTPLVDAQSVWTPPRVPMIFVNKNLSGERQRWTVAHETGHLVMHHRPSGDEEGEADEFAGELLMPQAEIRPLLNNLTLDKLATLKVQWKVSMAAILVRARRIGAIDADRYRFLNMEISRRRWRREEPNPIPAEQSATLNQILRFHVEELKYSLEDLCRLVTALPHEFLETFGFPAPAAEKRSLFRAL